ncbi:hypothetical protein B0H15DRAFT_1001840 [Mycena belliarum]|uniref:Cullin family profile domain-containing protein n=1 Tax=Mycena belliarum TaxID=1033014 RepID=A0AAD6XTS2_9AGAR|nr:hypothetical protein B0H15DRAFT_1001840 [Mycena belliae]
MSATAPWQSRVLHLETPRPLCLLGARSVDPDDAPGVLHQDTASLLRTFPTTDLSLDQFSLQLPGPRDDAGEVVREKVIDSFVSLGLDAADSNKECLDVYKEQFEAPFLAATETYYTAEAEAFLNAGGAEGSGNIPEYLKKAEGRLREEEERVTPRFESPSSDTPRGLRIRGEAGLTRVLRSDATPTAFDERGLRARRRPSRSAQASITAAGRATAAFARTRDERRTMRLLPPFDDVVRPVAERDASADFVRGRACSGDLCSEDLGGLVRSVHLQRARNRADSRRRKSSPKLRSAARAMQDADLQAAACAADDPKGGVQLARIARSHGPRHATRAQGLAMRDRETGPSAAVPSRRMGRRSDLARDAQRARSRRECDVERRIAGCAWTGLARIGGSDLCCCVPTLHACGTRSRASDEAEASMNSKLKEACGFEYTNKLQRMFTDMSWSKDLTDSFKERMAAQLCARAVLENARARALPDSAPRRRAAICVAVADGYEGARGLVRDDSASPRPAPRHRVALGNADLETSASARPARPASATALLFPVVSGANERPSPALQACDATASKVAPVCISPAANKCPSPAHAVEPPTPPDLGPRADSSECLPKSRRCAFSSPSAIAASPGTRKMCPAAVVARAGAGSRTSPLPRRQRSPRPTRPGPPVPNAAGLERGVAAARRSRESRAFVRREVGTGGAAKGEDVRAGCGRKDVRLIIQSSGYYQSTKYDNEEMKQTPPADIMFRCNLRHARSSTRAWCARTERCGTLGSRSKARLDFWGAVVEQHEHLLPHAVAAATSV